MFVCYQASIERQFELIQSKWLNDGDAFWLGAEKDFLTIPAPDPEQALTEGSANRAPRARPDDPPGQEAAPFPVAPPGLRDAAGAAATTSRPASAPCGRLRTPTGSDRHPAHPCHGQVTVLPRISRLCDRHGRRMNSTPSSSSTSRATPSSRSRTGTRRPPTSRSASRRRSRRWPPSTVPRSSSGSGTA